MLALENNRTVLEHFFFLLSCDDTTYQFHQEVDVLLKNFKLVFQSKVWSFDWLLFYLKIMNNESFCIVHAASGLVTLPESMFSLFSLIFR
jgi:hypothetical protein